MCIVFRKLILGLQYNQQTASLEPHSTVDRTNKHIAALAFQNIAPWAESW